MMDTSLVPRKREKGEQVSHKVIEKRRRDRINSCLAELSQAVPAAFTKQNSGKLEKAEILEMTVDYLRTIHALGQRIENGEWLGLSPIFYAELQRHYASGYSECAREVLRYITEVEGLHTGDARCARIIAYLHSKSAAATTASMNTMAASSLLSSSLPFSRVETMEKAATHSPNSASLKSLPQILTSDLQASSTTTATTGGHGPELTALGSCFTDVASCLRVHRNCFQCGGSTGGFASSKSGEHGSCPSTSIFTPRPGFMTAGDFCVVPYGGGGFGATKPIMPLSPPMNPYLQPSKIGLTPL